MARQGDSVPLVVGAYPHPFLRGTTSVTAVGVGAEGCARDRGSGARRGRREEADEELHRDQPQLRRPITSRSSASGTVRCSSSARRSRSGSQTIRRRSNAATESRRERRARRRAARSPRRRRAARLAGLGRRAHLRGAPRRRAARAGEAPLALSDRRADERPLGDAADAVRRGDRLASALDRADDPRARHDRHHTRGDRERHLPGTASRSGRARLRGLRAADRPRPAARLRRLGPPLDGGGRARDAARAAARARRARPAGGAARPGGRARRRRGCSRRSSQARSSAA